MIPLNALPTALNSICFDYNKTRFSPRSMFSARKHLQIEVQLRYQPPSNDYEPTPECHGNWGEVTPVLVCSDQRLANTNVKQPLC